MAEPQKTEMVSPKTISYENLIRYFLLFCAGVIVTFIVQNLIGKETITLSTLDIINIIFSVALSGASIFLAIVAINLAKESEKILIDRNQKSIEFQNNLFIKTSAILTKIESSTGVTEKRLEDLIAGRAGKAAQSLLPNSKVASPMMRKELENRIKTSFLEEPSVGKHGKEYDEFLKSTLNETSKIKGISVIKSGTGDFGEKGNDLVDGVFNFKNIKFSVSVFFSKNIFDFESIEEYIFSLAKELKNKEFDLAFLVFDEELNKENKYYKSMENQLNIIDQTIKKKIVIEYGSPEQIAKKISIQLKK